MTGTKKLFPVDLNKNNFDCIRFFLAVAVIYSHCFVISYAKIFDTEPISIFTHNQVDLGGVAVSCFFIISGFLIVKSFENSSAISEYIVKRLLRILPGFYVAFLISVLVFGGLGTVTQAHKFGQWRSYFHSIGIKKTVTQFFTLEAPRSAKTFSKNPLPNMINEAFWTIQYEFFCYLLVPLLGLVNILKRKWMAVVFFLIAYILLVLQITGLIPQNLGYSGNAEFLYPSEMPRLFSFFFAGTCFYFFRARIKVNRFLVLLAVASVLFGAWWVRAFNMLFPISGTYLLFVFAYSPRIQFHDFAKKGDFSYGLYLYGWPIQQLVMYFFAKHIDANRLFFIAFPLVFIVAYLSWHFVEVPFLKMKKVMKKKVMKNQPVMA
jgi:peptidoglycan/LPS O-acetylase OafA/YrhL